MKNIITIPLLTVIFLRILFEGFGYGNYIIPFIYFLFLIILIQNKKFLISSRYLYYFMFFFIVCSYGFVNSLSFTRDYFNLLSGVLRFGTFFVIALLFKRIQISFNILFNFYLLLLFIEFIVFSYQFFTGIEKPSGTMYSRNHIGVFLIPGIFISIIYLKNYMFSFFSLIFLIFLGGIGNLLSVFSSLFIYFLIIKKKIILGLSLISLLVFSFVLLFFNRILTILDNLNIISDRLDSGVVGGGDSLTWRLISWYNLWNESMEKNKFLFGFGLESTSSPSINIFGFQPHNDYVKVFIEVGFVGLIILFPILWSVFKKLSGHNLYDLSIRFSLVATMFSMFSNNVLLHVSYWWLMIGFLSIKRN